MAANEGERLRARVAELETQNAALREELDNWQRAAMVIDILTSKDMQVDAIAKTIWENAWPHDPWERARGMLRQDCLATARRAFDAAKEAMRS